jgi:hypothetical protein
MRGVWQHRKLVHPNKPHLAWKRECNHWNHYVSYRYVGVLAPLKTKIDVKCQGCGSRVRFNPYRSRLTPGRGRIQQVRYLERPFTMPKFALKKEAEYRNEFVKKQKELK